MSQSPRSRDPSSPRAFWLTLLSRPVLGVLLVLAILLGAAAWRSLIFIERELAPMVEATLLKMLNRPVKLGPLKRYSLTELEFGRSTIAPHTMTVSGKTMVDRDRASTESVLVRFNPWMVLVNQTVGLDVILKQPRAYVDRAPNNRWIGTTLTPLPEGWLKIKLNSIRATEGTVTLDALNGTRRILNQFNGAAAFQDNNRRIELHGTSQVDSGGQVAFNGTWLPPQQKLVLTTKSERLALVPLLGLLPTSPLKIKSGQYDGRLQVISQPQHPLKLTPKGILSNGDVYWPNPSVYAKAKQLKLDLAIALPANGRPILQGKASFAGAEAKASESLFLFNGRNRLQTVRNLTGTLNFLGASQRMQLDVKGALALGGQAKIRGEVLLPLEQAKLQIQGQNIPATLFDRAYRLPIQVKTGRVDGNITVQLRKNQRPSVVGNAALKQVDAQVQGVPQPFLNANGVVRFKGLTAILDRVTTNYGSIPVVAKGSIDPDRGYDLAVDTAAIEVNQALKTLQVQTLPFPIKGQVRVVDLHVGGAIKQPVMTGLVRSAGPVTLDRLPMKDIAAQFKLVPGLLTVPSIVVLPTGGGRVTGQATLNINQAQKQYLVNAQLRADNLSGDKIAQLYQANPGFALGLVNGTAVLSGPANDLQTAIAFQAPGAAYPTTGKALIHRGTTQLQDVVAQIKGGALYLNGLIAEGRVNLQAHLPGIALKAYDPGLRGLMSGDLAIRGPLAGFSAQIARAEGDVRFSEGLSLIQDPLIAQIRWDGNQILVDRATAPDFVARGSVGATLRGPQGPQLTTLNLDITAQRYDLSRLSTAGLPNNPLHGQADLDGKITGTVRAPRLNSNLGLSELKVSDLDFEPLLVGRLDFDMAQGLQLDVSGKRDRIQVALDAQQLPISLDIRREQTTIVGRRNTVDTFSAVFNNVPLLALNEIPELSQELGRLSGTASGNIDLNLRTRDAAGAFAVERPGLGRFLGDRLTGQVRYAKGVGTLSQAILVQGDNKYQLDATLVNSADPQIDGRLLITQAQLEDLVAVAKSLRLPFETTEAAAQGRAKDVQTAPVELSEVPLWEQLQRLAEIDQLLEQRKQQQVGNGIIPEWQKLKGRLAGEIRFSGSLQAGLSTTFDLNGQNWELDPYQFDRVVAKGRWDPSGLRVEPLTIASGESVASFTGRVGGPRQAGELTLQKLPVETVANALDLPVDLTGQLNGTATLSGQWDNPTLNGQFSLDQGVLNAKPIQEASAQFGYENARLSFNGLAKIESPEPLQLQGEIPYALPFSSVKPKSDQVNITMSVKDQGLALVNLFTDQLAWVDGKGELGLKVTGTLAQPLLLGSLTLQNATLQSPTFTEPLTQVNGLVRFNRDRIMVESLEGRYVKGELTAKGTLPVFDDKLQVNDPLSVALNNMSLDVRGLYRGQAQGNLNIMGSAFQPAISGFIALQNGQVLLSAAANANAPPEIANPEDTANQNDTNQNDTNQNNISGSANLTPPAGTTPSGTGGSGVPVEFQGLQVRLGENVRILQPPVLSFIASGQVNLNGSVDAPRPSGRVKFEKGNVYLFTTLFRVDQQKENYAQFTPAYGLDPYLNLSLRTTVTDVSTGRKTNLNEFADVQAGSLGSIESVRVRANIQGRASQLGTRFNDVLELSSTPERSQTEILALLSGGVSQSLASGDAQGALVNFASSALLNQIQGFADDVLGSRASFRLFPLLTPTKNNSSTILELGAELGYDVTDRFSVSLLQIVTSPDELPQLSINYDITDQFRARGSVNFQGDAVGILEYRIRF